MHDFFLPSPQWLINLTTPLCTSIGLYTLAPHIHEVLLAYIVYQSMYSVLSPRLSVHLFPKTYKNLTPARKIHWNMSVTSLIQSIIISTLALYVMFYDEERSGTGWEGRIYGYDGAMGLVQACATGYFIWDLGVCVSNFRLVPKGELAHAVCALAITSTGFRPFGHYYTASFLLYELSNPFLNIHWFLDKLSLTGSVAQLINGLLFASTFFIFRIIWGNYATYSAYIDILKAFFATDASMLDLSNHPEMYEWRLTTPIGMAMAMGEGKELVWQGDGLGGLKVGWVHAVGYMSANTVLGFLNVFWFYGIVRALWKRFQVPQTKGTKGAKEEKVKKAGEKDVIS